MRAASARKCGSVNGRKQVTEMPDLTTDQLATLLAQLDDMIRQAHELSDHIKTQIDARRDPSKPAGNWTDRRSHR